MLISPKIIYALQERVLRLIDHVDAVTSVSFSPDGRTLASSRYCPMIERLCCVTHPFETCKAFTLLLPQSTACKLTYSDCSAV